MSTVNAAWPTADVVDGASVSGQDQRKGVWQQVLLPANGVARSILILAHADQPLDDLFPMLTGNGHGGAAGEGNGLEQVL